MGLSNILLYVAIYAIITMHMLLEYVEVYVYPRSSVKKQAACIL